jgi:DNA-directed RNA polymerase
LVPAEKPSDIYTLVAVRLEEIVARDSETIPEAKHWMKRITRKIAKQPTMTMPYGAERFGYRGQIIDALRKIEQDSGKRHLPPGADDFACAGYLAGVMREALSGVVVKAAQAMDWLQTASRIASDDMMPIRWEAPIGLPVVQDYREYVGQRIETEIIGQRISLMVTREGDKLDKRKQAQGIAPNFVHSLDASHMMETVCLALGHGLTAFAMVHDSYGAHAGHADTLNRLLREAFVSLYREDVLGKFRSALIEQLPPKLAAKIPPLPQFGTLDPEAVLASEYFFA